jgi:cation transport ATPase
VDGIVAGGAAILDEAALTGEAHPVERKHGDQVRSGPTNAARTPFNLRATTTAEESTYAGIVRLVQQAQDSKAPLVRLADRYALFFLPLTLLVAAIAWIISGDPVRALAVLVVAHPMSTDSGCPDRHCRWNLTSRAQRNHRQGRRRSGDSG